MPRQTEPNANNALGELLRGMMPGCEVRSEGDAWAGAGNSRLLRSSGGWLPYGSGSVE